MAASSSCKTAVLKIYQDVMEDVIRGVRDIFAEDGVDEQVLQELRQTWETKLMASKAVETQEEIEKKMGAHAAVENGAGAGSFKQQQVQQQQQQQQQHQQHHQQQQQVVGQVPPNNHVPIAQLPENKLIPIQITLPAQPGTDIGPRVLTIQVPASAIQGNQLQKVLTGPVISATMSLPQNLASSVLQQHVNAALSSQQQAVTIGSLLNKPMIQTDGTADTSDEEDGATEDDDVSDEAEDEKIEEEEDMEEEEPLNSEDDVTDEEQSSDQFDTENVVVCQYDKITRSRNKWKFHLMDGIMNLNGEDYVFQKANGDAEW